jgi:hypothetical protein
MIKLKFALPIVLIFAISAFTALAEDVPKATAPATNSPMIAPSIAPRQHQGDVASATAAFGALSATADAYKTALDAHALADALKLVDKDGAFKGKVAKVFEPRGLAIVEFDQNYRSALTAIVQGTNFAKFPALTNLIGKDVLVTGKFVKYRDAAEIVLEKPEQIKLVK